MEIYNDTLKNRSEWENYISNIIHNQLIPQKSGGWLVICYQEINNNITHCRPDFREFMCAFYSVFADIVNNGEYCLSDAIIASFTSDWP